MKKKLEFLDPARPLVDEVVVWLCGDENGDAAGRVRRIDGAPSLAHVLVVVPTAQSGRSLRLALVREAARRGWGGLLPPAVAEPLALVRCADTSLRLASTVELCATFQRFVAETPLADFPHLFAPTLVRDCRAQLAFFDQLMDIWRILAGGGLTMSDVPENPRAAEVFAAATGDEATRWEELADFEQRFFERLHARGLRHQAEDIHLARTTPQPLADEIEEVVLPMLADPVAALYDALARQRDELKVTVLVQARPDEADKFDAWGRPRIDAWTGKNRPVLVELADADIIRAGTDAELAKRIAADFPPADAAVRRPALGLCDEELFPELAAAFLNRGYVLHNPERYRLAVSSLGRILTELIDLYAARRDRLPWKSFVALLRENDVLAELTSDVAEAERLGLRTAILTGIDLCQNRFLPTVLAVDCAYDVTSVRPHDQSAFAAFVAAGRRLLALLRGAWGEGADVPPVAFLRAALQAIFARRALSGSEAEKEFRAATDAVRECLSDAEGLRLHGVALLDEVGELALLRKTLAEATYPLEPTERNSVRTEGWLELVWSAADKIALAGFSEGAVPDSVVGHPFVPDTLRVALGLTSNAGRLARDTMLLCNLVRSRAASPGSVRAYLAGANAAGELRRPSRLLFLVAPERLAERVRTLFGDLPPGGLRGARQLEPVWRPNLPLGDVPLRNVSAECPEGRLSASALDAWLRCPFTYLLKCGLGMESFKEKTELEANDFGTLVHATLEDYAREQLARTAKGLFQLDAESDIAAALARLLRAREAAYGDRLPLRLRLQFDAAEGRLRAFARVQAFWAQAGWRIAEKPEFLFDGVRPFAGEEGCDLPFKGNIDRIDYKEGVGYRLIDYKTWDDRSKAKGHILAGGEDQLAFAARLKLPLVTVTSKGRGAKPGTPRRYRFLSVQLLLYARCLECVDAKFKGHIADCCYALLGKDAADTVVFGSVEDQGPFDAYRRASDRFPLIDYLNVALDTARTAIRRIRASLFWPPGPDEDWKRDYRGLFLFAPARDLPVGTPWRDEQEAKLGNLK